MNFDSFIQRLLKERHVSRLQPIYRLLERFSPSERLLLYVLSVTLAFSTFVLLAMVNGTLSVTVPASGGSFTEGEIGPARFINPVIAATAPDADIAALVYSGLMRAQPDGSYIRDLASGYTISDDGTVYTFKIRTNATFQDGTPVTARDVAFTVQATQRAGIKSVRQADWLGVTVSTPDDHTVVFTLPHAYGPFIENTTMGILPAHLWKNVSDQEFAFSQLNTHPVGSGPYRVTQVKTDDTGAVTRYTLNPFSGFTLGAAKISAISFVFFKNKSDAENAYSKSQIDAIAGVDPMRVQSIFQSRRDSALLQGPLPRVFGVFFNQNHAAVLANKSVRAALDESVDKQALVAHVLKGYGTPLEGPVPPGILGAFTPNTPAPTLTPRTVSADSETPKTPDERAKDARSILLNGGWSYDDTNRVWKKKSKKNSEVLTFTLATADDPELIATAREVAALWKAVGIVVQVQVYPITDFNLTVLRPRAYDAVLFGEVVGRQADFFAFWHSSQRNDPGLNLSMYTNARADSLLAQARTKQSGADRDDLYRQFEALVKKDQPAVFLYSPSFLYILPVTVHGVALGALTTPSERFLSAYQWYTQSENVWSVFAQ